jgi:signal peptidase I
MLEQQEIAAAEAENQMDSVTPPSTPAAWMPPPKSIIREYFEQFVTTVIMALFLMTFIAQAVQVPTGSMQNNIHIGDHLFVNKFLFGRNTPVIGPLLPAREVRRGDIVVFKFPSDPTVNYVKRVIGLPGDEVTVRGTRVFINGQELPEHRVGVALRGPEHSFNQEEIVEPPPAGATYKAYYDKDRLSEEGLETDALDSVSAIHGPVIVPPDSYFVMGDNRDNSQDSRYWGFVPRANVIGRALYVYWSFNRNQPDSDSEMGAPKSRNLLLDFFTKTNWRRTGTAIK